MFYKTFNKWVIKSIFYPFLISLMVIFPNSMLSSQIEPPMVDMGLAPGESVTIEKTVTADCVKSSFFCPLCKQNSN